MTVTELHSLGRRKIPAAQLHCRLHDMAVQKFRVGSLSQLTPGQCEELANFIDTLPDLPNSRTRRSGVYSNYSRRPRSGTGGDASLKMISAAQRELVYKLANKLEWPASVFYRWLETNFGLKHPDEIRTSKQANAVIKGLIYRKKQKEHPQPSRPARSSARPWGTREDRQPPAPAGPAPSRTHSDPPWIDDQGRTPAQSFFVPRPASAAPAAAPVPSKPQTPVHKEVPIVQQSLF